jgi:hypothetical protein
MKAAYIIATVAGYKHGSQLIITQQPQSQVLSLFYHNPTKFKKCTTFIFYVCAQQITEVTPHLCQSTCRIFVTAMLTRPNTNPTQMHVKLDEELMFY